MNWVHGIHRQVAVALNSGDCGEQMVKRINGYSKLIALADKAFDPRRRMTFAARPLVDVRDEAFIERMSTMPDRAGELLIAVSIKKIEDAPYIGPDGHLLKRATILGQSTESDLNFTMTSGLLNPEQVRRCELLNRHGFTVVQVPDNWRYSPNGEGGWQDVVIQRAMERVAAIYESKEGIKPMGAYDAELASAVAPCIM